MLWRARDGLALMRIVGLALAAVVTAGCGVAGTNAAPQPTASYGWRGLEPDPVPKRPSFVLRDTEGNQFDFAAETRGRPTYLYFGYTNCPDECPTALADIAAALRQSPAALRERVRVVLVTTDPERDTPFVMRRFLDQFSEDFIGLVGSQAEVDAAQKAVGVRPAEKGENVKTLPGQPDAHEHKPGTAPHQHFGPLGYGVGHANVIFAYSSDDELPVVYPGGVRPADIAADLPQLAA